MTMYSSCDTPKGGFPHSEISGSKLICQLPEAYRRLSRPSSPVIAKASTTCTYSLDPITLLPLAKRTEAKSFGTSHDHRKLSRLCTPAILKPGHDAIHNPVCLLLEASSQRPFRKHNYLLSQIVKEQPKCFLRYFSKNHQSIAPRAIDC